MVARVFFVFLGVACFLGTICSLAPRRVCLVAAGDFSSTEFDFGFSTCTVVVTVGD